MSNKPTSLNTFVISKPNYDITIYKPTWNRAFSKCWVHDRIEAPQQVMVAWVYRSSWRKCMYLIQLALWQILGSLYFLAVMNQADNQAATPKTALFTYTDSSNRSLYV